MKYLTREQNAPFQTYAGADLYPTRLEKAARLCFGLVKDHTFIDGNKRLGAHAMLVFLGLNGVNLSYSQHELIKLIMSAASGRSGVDDILNWLWDHVI